MTLNLSSLFLVCIQDTVFIKLQMTFSFSHSIVLCLFFCFMGLWFFGFLLIVRLIHVNKLSVSCLKIVETFYRTVQKLFPLRKDVISPFQFIVPILHLLRKCILYWEWWKPPEFQPSLYLSSDTHTWGPTQ